GRARMCELTNSPTLAAALDPASTAALTLPTSPLHSTVIRPPPIGMVFTRLTLAALTMASLASTLPTYPFVSIIPNASFILFFLFAVSQFMLINQIPRSPLKFPSHSYSCSCSYSYSYSYSYSQDP